MQGDYRSKRHNLCRWEKKASRIQALPGFEPWSLQYPCSALTNRVSKPTAGSWSVNWFVIYQGRWRWSDNINDIHNIHRFTKILSQGKHLLVKLLLFKIVVRNLILCTLSQTFGIFYWAKTLQLRNYSL